MVLARGTWNNCIHPLDNLVQMRYNYKLRINGKHSFPYMSNAVIFPTAVEDPRFAIGTSFAYNTLFFKNEIPITS